MTRGDDLILLTGASGCVGGRLRQALEADGRRPRCMARRLEYLRARVAESTEVVAGDVSKPETLAAALRVVHTAYYLVHSMAGGRRDVDALSLGHGGLLAGRGGRARPPAPPGRRDAPAGARVAAVRGEAGSRREPHTPDRAVRAGRTAGLLYWYGLWGIHQLVFAGMLRNIVRAAAELR